MMRFENAMGVCHIDTLSCHTEGVSPKYPKRQLAKQRYLFGYFATLSMTGKEALE